jgi:NAD(P)H dehydrogenase (quinone)
MPDRNHRTLLVTGASGHLGRRVVELLLASHAGRIVAATRRPETLADLGARGAIIRRADFDDLESLQSAFAGIERMLLVSTDAIGRRSEQHRRAVNAAVRAGVGHVVYTSLPRPDANPLAIVSREHHDTEVALIAAHLGWTVLRNNLYTDLLPQRLAPAIATGRLLSIVNDRGAAYVTREDCARAAAAALAGTQTGPVRIGITGPAVITDIELAQVATELTGRQVHRVVLESPALRRSLIDTGISGLMADAVVSLYVAMAQGRLADVTSGVEELTGRQPTSVAAFLVANRELLVADHQAQPVG